MLLHKSGIVDLLHSTFQANFDANSSTNGTGIVNLGGEVLCDSLSGPHARDIGCFPVCTACVSPPPTPQPTTVEILPSPQPTGKRNNFGVWFSLAFGLGLALALLMVGVLGLWRRRMFCFGVISNCRTIDLQAEENLPNQPFLRPDDATVGSSAEPRSIELVTRPVIMKSYENSPAAVFVVALKTMRITLWSPGMSIAVPTLVHPEGWLLSSLPFVNESDGYLLHRALGRIFEAPDEHDERHTFVLHLVCQNKEVLIEMVATHVTVAESDPIIVMTGRIVDNHLAGLMSRKSAVATSEISADEHQDDHSDRHSFRFRSVSQAGSSKGSDEEDVPLPINRDADEKASSISSLSMPPSVYPPAMREMPTCPPPSDTRMIAADAAPPVPKVPHCRPESRETNASHGSAARAVNSILAFASSAYARRAPAGHGEAHVRVVNGTRDSSASSSGHDLTGSAAMVSCADTGSSDVTIPGPPPLGEFDWTHAATPFDGEERACPKSAGI